MAGDSESNRFSAGSVRVWLALAAAGGLAIGACYAPALAAPFLMDDPICIAANPSIRSLARLSDVVFYPHQEGRPVDGRPLLNLSLAINRAVAGTMPSGFRSVNIFLHWLAACLLFDVVRRLLAMSAVPEVMSRRPIAIAFVAVLAWALHPVHTAAVTYIIQRSEILAGIFLLAGLDLAITGLVTGRVGLLPCVGFAAAIGGTAKETIVSLPGECRLDRARDRGPGPVLRPAAGTRLGAGNLGGNPADGLGRPHGRPQSRISQPQSPLAAITRV